MHLFDNMSTGLVIGLLIALAVALLGSYLLYRLKVKPTNVDNSVRNNQNYSKKEGAYYDHKKFTSNIKNLDNAASEALKKSDSDTNSGNSGKINQKQIIFNPQNNSEWVKKLRPRFKGFFSALIFQPSKKLTSQDQDNFERRVLNIANSSLSRICNISLAKLKLLRYIKQEFINDANKVYDPKTDLSAIYDKLWVAAKSSDGSIDPNFNNYTKSGYVAPSNEAETSENELPVYNIKDHTKEKSEENKGLKEFRKANNLLSRIPHLQTNSEAFLHWAVIMLILIIETIANGIFFSQKLEGGLIGGVIAALAFTSLNLLLGWVAGTSLKYTHVKSSLRARIFSWPCVVIGLVAMFHLNLLLGAYRSVLGADSTGVFDASKLALSNLLNQYLGSLDSVESILLFVLGIIFGAIATAKFYQWKDKCGGYYKKYFDCKAVTDDYNYSVNEFKEWALKIRKFGEINAQEYTEFLELGYDQFESIQKIELETAGTMSKIYNIMNKSVAEIIRLYRNLNRKVRAFMFSKPPAYFDQPIAQIDATPVIEAKIAKLEFDLVKWIDEEAFIQKLNAGKSPKDELEIFKQLLEKARQKFQPEMTLEQINITFEQFMQATTNLILAYQLQVEFQGQEERLEKELERYTELGWREIHTKPVPGNNI